MSKSMRPQNRTNYRLNYKEFSMALSELTSDKYIVMIDRVECRVCGQSVKRGLPRNDFERKRQNKALNSLAKHFCDPKRKERMAQIKQELLHGKG